MKLEYKQNIERLGIACEKTAVDIVLAIEAIPVNVKFDGPNIKALLNVMQYQK